MIYACRQCGREESRGCLPTATCGMLIVVMQGITIALLLSLIDARFPDGLGWWWLVAGPLVFLASIPLGLMLYAAMIAVEWLAICRQRCPACGARKWSWGFTRGFGL